MMNFEVVLLMLGLFIILVLFGFLIVFMLFVMGVVFGYYVYYCGGLIDSFGDIFNNNIFYFLN